MQVSTVFGVLLTFSLVAGVPGPGNSISAAPVPLAAEKPKGDSVEIDKLPKAVVDAVQKDLPGAKLTKAMKLTDGNYLLSDVKVGKKEYTITVTPEGKILKREVDDD